MNGEDQLAQEGWTSINITNHQFHNSPPHSIKIKLPPLGTKMGITIKDYQYHNMPYIQSSLYIPPYQKDVPSELNDNTWILAVVNNNPGTALQAMTDIQSFQQQDRKSEPVTFVLAKISSKPATTQIEQD